jgi:hypothetical protein
MKAAKNLDAPLKQGNNPTEQSFINFTSEQISHNLENLGFCLGQDTESISASVTELINLEVERMSKQENPDSICSIFDTEEKEMLEEEEVDKLFLNALCSDIMDEVMDSDSAYPMDGKTDQSEKSPSSSSHTTKRSKKGKRNNKHSTQ